jgi:hypothetical protein
MFNSKYSLDITLKDSLSAEFRASLPLSKRVSRAELFTIREKLKRQHLSEDPLAYLRATLTQDYSNLYHSPVNFRAVRQWSEVTRSIYTLTDEPPIVGYVFDFYSLYTLWFSLHGKEKYGYPNSTILCHARESALNEKFRFVTRRLALCIIDALDRAIRREARHTDGCLEGIRFKYPKLDYSRLTHSQLLTLFSMDCWSDCYGGLKWAQGTKALMELVKVYNSDDLQEMIMWIDIILDLQHNSGFIMNKTEFRKLSTTHLNYRAKARTLTELSVYCTPAIYEFIKSYNLHTPTPIPSCRVLVGCRTYQFDITPELKAALKCIWPKRASSTATPKKFSSVMKSNDVVITPIPRDTCRYHYDYINSSENTKEKLTALIL